MALPHTLLLAVRGHIHLFWRWPDSSVSACPEPVERFQKPGIRGHRHRWMDQVELGAGDRQGLRRSSNLVKKRGKILLGALLEGTRMGALWKSSLHNGRYFALGFLALLWAVAARELWPIKAAVEAVPDASEGGAPVILALRKSL